ncbi:MAG: hypothetical protein F4226_01525 [Synechococcus sp. SB0678_bin_12]|nr:hypothetical protein [Synechococcus sp. SB0678_bin_12]MYI87350.1 hypothetical protein [Synechococcus sp. SB0672_bin_10]
MNTLVTPTIGITTMAACVSLVVQSPVSAGTAHPGRTLLPQQQQAEIAQVINSSDAADWEETHYLESIPGVGKSIREGLATPVSELREVDLTQFLNLV